MDEVEGVALLVEQLVGFLQTVEDVEDDADRDPERKLLAFGLEVLADLLERRTIDVVHDDEQRVRRLLDVDRGHHVGVPDPRREPGFVEEHPDEVRVVGDVGVHQLERHQTLEAALTDHTAEVHGGHPTRRYFR